MRARMKLMTGIAAIIVLMHGYFFSPGNNMPVVYAGSGGQVAAGQDESRESLTRKHTLNEINRYLADMNSRDLAASLKLLRVMKLLELQYPEEVDTAKLFSGALKGTVEALDDPYSAYMDPETYKEYATQMSGSFSGIGIVIGTKDKVLTVVAPIEGTPGEQAGIVSGDQILKIDGRDTKDMALDEAVRLIRGPAGSKVVLTIGRSGEEIREYTVIRANVEIKTVTGKILQDDIGYIRLSMFNEHTVENFLKELRRLESQNMRAMILDLRNNPGGLLEEGVRIADHFVPQGPVVSYVSKDGSRMTFYSYLPAPKYPLVVLINGGSASAAEIVAGAVQDTGAGTLIGTKTFGKGSMQRVMLLEDASAVKLTVAKWFTPGNRPIDGVGLEPDITIEMPDFKNDGQDLQLAKAVEVLKSKLQ